MCYQYMIPHFVKKSKNNVFFMKSFGFILYPYQYLSRYYCSDVSIVYRTISAILLARELESGCYSLRIPSSSHTREMPSYHALVIM
jgi:hypothetical protein